MKLLFDENLSFKIVENIQDIFPESIHIKDIGLEKALDQQIWEYARDNKFLIVTKDSDFWEKTLLYGHPPKIIWICRGNCSTAEISNLIRRNHDTIQLFSRDNALSVLTIYI